MAQPAAARRVDVAGLFEVLVHNVERVIQGKREQIHLALVCLFAEGHLLIEDVPGVGKTSLAKALARSIGGTSHRIQFTPDLLPSDVIGVVGVEPGDEPVRVPPRRRVRPRRPRPTRSTGRRRRPSRRCSRRWRSARSRSTRTPWALPRPFLVIATQNPVELEGTYPLPEAQLDRFLMRLPMGYPGREAEMAILETHGVGHVGPDDLQPVDDPGRHRRGGRRDRRRARRAGALRAYIVDLVERDPPRPASSRSA